VKVSPDAVTMPGRKACKNRHLVCGIVTRLLLELFNFLASRAPRVKENLRSMEQCSGGDAVKLGFLREHCFTTVPRDPAGCE